MILAGSAAFTFFEDLQDESEENAWHVSLISKLVP